MKKNAAKNAEAERKAPGEWEPGHDYNHNRYDPTLTTYGKKNRNVGDDLPDWTLHLDQQRKDGLEGPKSIYGNLAKEEVMRKEGGGSAPKKNEKNGREAAQPATSVFAPLANIFNFGRNSNKVATSPEPVQEKAAAASQKSAPKKKRKGPRRSSSPWCP